MLVAGARIADKIVDVDHRRSRSEGILVHACRHYLSHWAGRLSSNCRQGALAKNHGLLSFSPFAGLWGVTGPGFEPGTPRFSVRLWSLHRRKRTLQNRLDTPLSLTRCSYTLTGAAAALLPKFANPGPTTTQSPAGPYEFCFAITTLSICA